ncbi:MAG: hypothetical protein C4547_11575 [Phycisphaerales bacterium]|nr:MAG: hypothetical protein C4547_11575 [Phycisphaerales bacterium]
MISIDLYQLPIPAWNLPCPKCGYCLNGLPSHRCPECGQHLDMEAIVPTHARLREPAWTGTELPLPDFGLHCDSCGAPLAGAVQRRCPACGRPFSPFDFRPDGEWIALSGCVDTLPPTSLIADRLADQYVPHVVLGRENVSELFGLTSAGPGLGESIYVPADFYFDVLALVRAWAAESGSGDAADKRSEWSCAECGEFNPSHFELCWNCQAQRGRE